MPEVCSKSLLAYVNQCETSDEILGSTPLHISFFFFFFLPAKYFIFSNFSLFLQNFFSFFYSEYFVWIFFFFFFILNISLFKVLPCLESCIVYPLPRLECHRHPVAASCRLHRGRHCHLPILRPTTGPSQLSGRRGAGWAGQVRGEESHGRCGR